MTEAIVPLEPIHLDGCAAVFGAAFSGPPWSEPWTSSLARTRLADLIAIPRAAGLVTIDTTAAQPIALALGYAYQAVDGLGFRLAEFCVHPDAQGRGVGARLLRQLEQAVADLGARSISLTTEGDAVGFYARLGYDPQPDWIAMLRRLS